MNICELAGPTFITKLSGWLLIIFRWLCFLRSWDQQPSAKERCGLVITCMNIHILQMALWHQTALFLSTHADTVTDFSTEDKASAVKFCMAVHQRPGQGISPSPKSDELASAPPPQCSQRLLFVSRIHDRTACGCRIGMCGYTFVP